MVDEFASRLAKIERFVDAARLACDETLRLGMYECCVYLHATSGPPVLAIDNCTTVSDEIRPRHVGAEGAWLVNPVFVRFRERLEVLGANKLGAAFAAPVIGAGGWFGTVMCNRQLPHLPEIELDLVMMVSHFAAWCANHGISRVPDLGEDRWLSPRQFRIAQLAIDGRTNSDIAAELGISINTVKVRLKQAFARLGVSSREELARLIRQLAPLDGVPIGVSKHDSVMVTRSTKLGSWV